MYIKRIRIEEGFLDGLDIDLSLGLNVIIGARGTGKTSLIELIRFGLGVAGNTSETSRRSKDHALSVLGSGQITLTLEDEQGLVTVSRSASDEFPRSSAPFALPVIYSQTEIETIGLQASGRLQLIDSFATSTFRDLSFEQQAIAEFSSVNVEIEKVRRELDELDRQMVQMPAIVAELKIVEEQEKSVGNHSQEVTDKTNALNLVTSQLTDLTMFTVEGQRIQDGLGQWYQQVKMAADASPYPDTELSAVLFPALASQVMQVRQKLTDSLEEISTSYYAVKALVDSKSSQKVLLEDVARNSRKELETLSEGAGSILRRGQQLREQLARIKSVAELVNLRRTALNGLIARRGEIQNSLEVHRRSRFDRRQETVNELNRSLGPKIRIKLTQNAQTSRFASAISDALRGSGLRFGDVAISLAENISPRALLEAVDSFDIELISDVAGIQSDRAARVLAHLRTSDLGAIGSIDIDDNASFQLLDGKDYKDFSALSTGQRCTVVLPMVLAHRQKMIIVDQPEDHIDNAFIADTLIKAINARDKESQIIFSTHNPNIPVLGSADTVLQLASDGKRGFKMAMGNLDDLSIVLAISNVMEGGAQAFLKRSHFYEKISLL